MKCLVHKLERRSVHIVGPEKNNDDSNGSLLQNAYHIFHCVRESEPCTAKTANRNPSRPLPSCPRWSETKQGVDGFLGHSPMA